AWSRRHEDFRFEAGRLDQRRLADLGRQAARLDQFDVAVEPCSLVASAHLGHDAEDPHLAAIGQRPLCGDDIVELEVATTAIADPHPELERGRVLGADHPAHDVALPRLLHDWRPYQGGVTARLMVAELV